MTDAERVMAEIDAVGSLSDYAWGAGIAIKDNTWRRATKLGPENTSFHYADRSVVWWSPDRGSWMAGQ